MVYSVQVGYPSAAGARFDMKYYLSNHMPLVQKKWSSFGLEHWAITQCDDSTSPYSVLASLLFKDKKSFDAALGDSDEVFGDIPNFTDLKPTLFHGEQVGAQS